MVRSAPLILAWLLTSCAAPRAPLERTPPGGATTAISRGQHNPCCSEPEGAPASAVECVAKGCSYGPALICRGMQPPPDVEAREREDLAACRIQCACTCKEDVEACARVP